MFKWLHGHKWKYDNSGVFPEPKHWRRCKCGSEQCYLIEPISGVAGWFDSKKMITLDARKEVV